MELEVGSQSTLRKVSYAQDTVGKVLKNSKLKIQWEFECNRQHHTILLSWSKRTGKQEIHMDSQLVWFGKNKGRSVLDHHWTTPTLTLHVLATCAPNTNFRNCDLVINGQLFESLPAQTTDRLPPKEDTHSIIDILYPNGYQPPTYNDSSLFVATNLQTRNHIPKEATSMV